MGWGGVGRKHTFTRALDDVDEVDEDDVDDIDHVCDVDEIDIVMQRIYVV